MDSVIALDPGSRYIQCGLAGRATPFSFRTDQVGAVCSTSQIGSGAAACSRAGLSLHGGAVMLAYNQAGQVSRPQLAEEAFETWGVARLGMASACGLALWASNVPDMGALVIDFGHLLTSATPFYAGYPLQQDPANTVYGGLHATCALEEALPPDARAYAEFLKIRHGTVHSQTGPQYYELPDGTKLCLGPDAISRHVRACADAVLREIPMERDPFRGRTACKRIVLCGGGGAVEDLPEYLAHRTGVPCWVNQDPQSLAWLGASLLGGMRSQFESRSVTKEEHEEKGGASLYAARCLL